MEDVTWKMYNGCGKMEDVSGLPNNDLIGKLLGWINTLHSISD